MLDCFDLIATQYDFKHTDKFSYLEPAHLVQHYYQYFK